MKKKKYELDTLAFTNNAYVSKWSKIEDIAHFATLLGIAIVLASAYMVDSAAMKLREELGVNGYQVTTSRQKDVLRKLKEECDKNVIEND